MEVLTGIEREGSRYMLIGGQYNNLVDSTLLHIPQVKVMHTEPGLIVRSVTTGLSILELGMPKFKHGLKIFIIICFT